MHNKNWRKWCRLCGTQNDSNIDIAIKLENFDSLALAIIKYFNIRIPENINSSYKICLNCYNVINSVIKYNSHVSKVNEMFLELESNYLDENINVESLREKYELIEKKNNLNYAERSSDFLHEDILESITQNGKYDTPFSKCFVEETFVDINEMNGLESATIPSKNNINCLLNNKNLKKKHNFGNIDYRSDNDICDSEEKQFKCPKCEKSFKFKRYVGEHIRRVHRRDQRFTCDVCGEGFATKKFLADHFSTHKEERKYKCSECGKGFKKKQDLRIHLAIHDGVGCICQICGLKLNTRRLLRSHMVVHSDEKKFKCNVCSKEFKRSKEFKNHLILHTGLKPYECPFCKLNFANGSNCRKHQKTVHPVELAAEELKGQHKLYKSIPSIKELNALVFETVS